MMNTTTVEPRRRRGGMGRIWMVAVALNLAVLLPFFIWQDLRRSDFTVAQKTPEELAEEQRRRQELEKKPKPEIPKEQVEKAKEHIEKRKKAALKKEVEELERLKDEIELLKDEQLDVLEERDEDDFLEQLVEAIQEQAAELALRAEDLEQADQTQAAKQVRDQARRLRDEAKRIQAPVEQPDGSKAVPNQEQVRTVAALAREAATASSAYAERQPSPQADDVEERAERLASRAESLANGDAMAALDGFSSDIVPSEEALANDLASVQAEAAALAAETQAMQDGDASAAAAAINSDAQRLSQDAQAMPAPGANAAALAEHSASVADQAQAVAQQTAPYASEQPSAQSAMVNDRAQNLANRASDLARNAAAASAAQQADLAAMSSEALYQRARELERAIAAHFADSKAAELALTQATSFQKGLEAVATPRTHAADLGDSLSQDPGNREELAAFAAAMDQAIANAARAADNARSQLGQAQGRQDGRAGGEMSLSQSQLSSALSGALGQASMQQDGSNGMMVDLTSLMSQAYGGMGSESGIRAGSNMAAGGQAMGQGIRREKITLDANRIKAQALPGRKFSRSSSRTGWLFIDSWYVMGPFENHGKIDFSNRHPPETHIDFDGEYIGKRGKKLTWNYLQSNVMRINPPDEQSNSTYYGYTEVWFEEATDMLLAVASDDAAKVWINDIVVWQDTGLSSWKLDEGFRKVRFKQGFNTVLVRIENGPVVCYYSILLCPSSL